MGSSAASRAGRIAAAFALAAAVMLPAASSVAGAGLVLRVGTTQDLDSLNPYKTALVVGYEAFLLTYDQLVSFGPDLEPYPGFADTWERAADGKSWTFHIRDGMKWSDGQPATSADACYSWQLDLDAIKDGKNVGLGYIDPGVSDAGVSKVECPDASTMIVYTDDPSQRVLQTYVPILPQHVFGNEDYKTVAKDKDHFKAPLVGTGPYQATEWKTGQSITFQRNPNYWGKQPAADTVVIQIFKNPDTMFQALKNGELDYAHGLNSDQFNQLKGAQNIETVVGASNGWTELGFNTYGTGTGKTIKNGGPSTQALLDPAFRDALGYAIDEPTLVQRVLGGYGDVGTTIVPPVLGQWHVEPDHPRTFNIDTAKQKLQAAGYQTNSQGQLLDKQGKVISLRLYFPDSDDNYPKAAQFIQSWFGQLGIKVTPQQFDSGTLVDKMLPPEAGDGYTADYDLFIWGWAGNPDPNALLQIFECSAIGSSSDSEYCNQQFDDMYKQQNKAPDEATRKQILAQMQNLIYDEAPYHILYYDSNLDAYRTDRFAGWQNQPTANGTPLFSYSTIGYTFLTDAAAATPAPSASSGAPAPSASSGTVGGSSEPGASATTTPSEPAASGGGDNTLLLVVAAVVIVVVVGGVLFARGRNQVEEE
jgi:peptide/nickel transport system substrate-binding protein